MFMLPRIISKRVSSFVQGLILRVRNDVHIQNLLRTSGILYIGGLVALILVLIQQFSLANLLGSSGYGRLAIIISSGLLAMLFLDFRTWEMGIKLLTTEITNQRHLEIIRIANWLISIELLTGLFGMLLLFIFAEPLATHLLNISGFDWLIRFYAISLPFRVVADGVFSTIPRVYNRFKWVTYRTIANNLLRLILMVGLTKLGYGLSGAVIGAVISDMANFIMVMLIARYILKREIPHFNLFDRTPPIQKSAGYRMMADFWIVSSLVGLNLQAIIPFMSLFTSPAQVGLFRIGLDIAQFIDKLAAPITLGITSQIMHIYQREKWVTFVHYIKQTFIFFLLVVIPLTLGILILGPWIFPKLLHDLNYVSLPPVASIVSVGYAFAVAIIPWARPTLIVIGRSRIQSIIMLLQTLTMFAMVWWLTPQYGALGTAVAMAVPMTLSSLCFLFFWGYISKWQLHPRPLETTS